MGECKSSPYFCIMENYIIQIKSDDYNKLILENKELSELIKKLEKANRAMFETKAKEFMETNYEDYIIGYWENGNSKYYMQLKKDDKRLDSIIQKMEIKL